MPPVEEILKYLASLLGLDAATTWDAIKSKLDAIKSESGVVAAKFKSAMKELGLKDDASADDVKAFAAKYKSILDLLQVKASATIDEIKTVITAKGTPQQIDMKSYVLKSEYDTMMGQMKDIQIADVIAKHQNRGALHVKEIEIVKKDFRDGRYTMKEIDEQLALRPDYSIIPLQEIKAKGTPPAADGNPTVDAVKEYAAKNKVSFRDAAIALASKKK